MLLFQKWHRLVVVGGVMGCARSALLSTPAITPAPQNTQVELRSISSKQDLDVGSVMDLLLTAIPTSLLQVAATDAPAVSSILSSEFLADTKPDWIRNLPQDVQYYLSKKFSASKSWPTSSSMASTESRIVNISSTSSATSLHTAGSSSTRPLEPHKKSHTEAQHFWIEIAIGTTVGLLILDFILIGFCFLWRRRRQRHFQSRDSLSSLGFTPRSSFYSIKSHTYWDDDERDVEEWEAAPEMKASASVRQVMAPAIVHTRRSSRHVRWSSRARRNRTDYARLSAVTEVTEPDENSTDSVISGKKEVPSSAASSLQRFSQSLRLDVPLKLVASSIKHRSLSRGSTANSHTARHGLPSLRDLDPTKTHHHHHHGHIPGRIGLHTNKTTHVSVREQESPSPTFHDYFEDYSLEDGLHGGGYRSFDRYPLFGKNSCNGQAWKHVIKPPQKSRKSPLQDQI